MYRRNMSGKLKKVVLFMRLSILLLLSRPFESYSLILIHQNELDTLSSSGAWVMFGEDL